MNSNKSQPAEGERSFTVHRVTRSNREDVEDTIAVEEPMEIRIVFGPASKRKGRSLSVTMRTPDHDFELAAGFLLTEGIIECNSQIDDIEFCGEIAEGRLSENRVRVYLNESVTVNTQSLQRHFYTTSSCGVCGKASLEAIENQNIGAIDSDFEISANSIYELTGQLRTAQLVFDKTGGIHAAGLFDNSNNLICIREDVGRHNAVDKLIGNRLLADKFPLGQNVLVVSGRASFELMQKSISARIPMMISVGAPSSLAIELAQRFNATLVGFAGGERFNVYAGKERIRF